MQRKLGFTISTIKTPMMSINTTPTAPVTLNGEPHEFVEDFTYSRVASSVKTMKPEKTSKQDWAKPTVLLLNCRIFGSPINLPGK